MEKFTIEEIKNYLKAQDSLGDIFYNLSAENIRKANPIEEVQEYEFEDMSEEDIAEFNSHFKVEGYEESDESVEGVDVLDMEATKKFIVGDGLVWEEIHDENIVLDILSQIDGVEPYYSDSSLHISETRFIIDEDRYRILEPIGSEGQTIEQLIDSSDCQHKNTYWSNMKVCLDCNILLGNE